MHCSRKQISLSAGLGARKSLLNTFDYYDFGHPYKLETEYCSEDLDLDRGVLSSRHSEKLGLH